MMRMSKERDRNRVVAGWGWRGLALNRKVKKKKILERIYPDPKKKKKEKKEKKNENL